MNHSSENKNSISKIILWLGTLAASFALLVYMYLGIFTRYMADDYCLLVDLRSSNIFAASWEKYLVSSNRFSNLFVLGFWELFSKHNIAYVPAFLILLWIGGLYWLFTEIRKTFDIKIHPLLLFLGTELLVVFTFYTAPNLFQSIYWRPGQVTYFTPLVLFTLLAASASHLTRRAESKPLSATHPLLFAFIAFFIGGLSETLGTLHIAALTLAILGVILFDKSPRRKPALTLLIATLIGALAAILAMLFSPANSLRIQTDSPPPGLIELILRSLQFAYSFILSAFRLLPTPTLATLVISFLLSYVYFTQTPQQKPNPRFWLAFIIIPIITYGLIVAIVAPSAYGQSYPVERVRFPAHFVFTLAIISLGVCLAWYVSQIKFPNYAHGIALALLAFSLLYPIRIGIQSLEPATYMKKWAEFWDWRVTYIADLKTQGYTNLTIPALSGFFSTKELDVRENFWVNQCAAQYYDVKSIRAIPGPGAP